MNVQPDFKLWGAIKREFEGIELKAYADTGGIPTIGFGATFNHKLRRKVKMGDFITYDEALMFWQIDSAETVRLANVYIKRELNASQSTAICDYIYNRGIGNFLKAEFNGWGLDELINSNPLDLRIIEIIQQTGLKDRLGNLLNGLIRRRKCQAYLYKTGELKFQFK